MTLALPVTNPGEAGDPRKPLHRLDKRDLRVGAVGQEHTWDVTTRDLAAVLRAMCRDGLAHVSAGDRPAGLREGEEVDVLGYGHAPGRGELGTHRSQHRPDGREHVPDQHV